MSTSFLNSEEFLSAERRRNEIHADLMMEGIPTITAIVMAGDIYSAEQATELIRNGTPAEDALHYVGSYARFDWAVSNLPKPTLFKMLPELWTGADPDDTKPEYLALWKEAYAANKNKIIQDEPGKIETLLTNANSPLFKVYRGQIGDNVGISWTLDKKIAKTFAATGGGRQTIRGGRILTRIVKRSDVLAYLTGRGESEVIIDPYQGITTPAPNDIIDGTAVQSLASGSGRIEARDGAARGEVNAFGATLRVSRRRHWRYSFNSASY